MYQIKVIEVLFCVQTNQSCSEVDKIQQIVIQCCFHNHRDHEISCEFLVLNRLHFQLNSVDQHKHHSHLNDDKQNLFDRVFTFLKKQHKYSDNVFLHLFSIYNQTCLDFLNHVLNQLYFLDVKNQFSQLMSLVFVLLFHQFFVLFRHLLFYLCEFEMQFFCYILGNLFSLHFYLVFFILYFLFSSINPIFK